MVPNPQLCRMFSASLYERYSSFTASLYPRIMGSVGFGRSNFIDKLAELEGARAPHGVGSHTWDIRDIAVKLHDHCEHVFVDTPGFENSVRPAIQVFHTIVDWLGRNSAEHQGAIESMSNSGRLEFQCGTSVQVVPVSIVRHPWARTTHDQDCWASREWGWWEHGPDNEPVTYPASDRIIVSCDQIGIVGQLWGPIVIGRPGSLFVTFSRECTHSSSRRSRVRKSSQTGPRSRMPHSPHDPCSRAESGRIP
ncbi:hypothetical protein PISMIDRAFT_276021 [Pisolithus microcarpus 441]|uniref:G domain-containing protein n=1 Tax=Pisolithus microcarpus 441 TaxID=765257 RepID=A0A0C9Z1I2_9AGAM|nr:hypothetical protein BKA83DRAFT_276021 [Pisolithus microcarpus]KIK16172.1 hypothetical protein PISMIDRAFT_276021 [Pisolithus microcarpus 441]